jgi:hypothetical protein
MAEIESRVKKIYALIDGKWEMADLNGVRL